MAAIVSSKKALRKSITAALRSLPGHEIQCQSQAITQRLLSAPFFQRSHGLSCYLSMPTGEVDTAEIVSSVLRSGKTLFVPKIDKSVDGKMDFLRVYDVEDANTLPTGVWGIREPPYEWQDRPRASDGAGLDLIVLPGVAFDESRSRLGHGKGYYDRFISACTAHALKRDRQRPLLVALALREQVLPAASVPMAEHDWKVDMIVHPDGIIGDEAAAEPSRGRDGGGGDDSIGRGGSLADAATIAVDSVLLHSRKRLNEQ
ncbi:nagb/rpia/CoA transferase-like protein [Punctularia strigosozonata HHB-11173 SS5]|uniref:nagb/rpia/CoA transferase-like protein n=1 Tax=Punctularia strigosozonata (strain HHB-11173) TaxID=741275 RepID=UPI00044183E6|nr:nagb/rpia/CoA transferase-like protein [Punctularia strigosozonata HHB-11173 SS5]EIN08570.1 nagb/rpia/CoA transferase-like protein [Punctularia strigosozonata HHB-11173 SS5]